MYPMQAAISAHRANNRFLPNSWPLPQDEKARGARIRWNGRCNIHPLPQFRTLVCRLGNKKETLPKIRKETSTPKMEKWQKSPLGYLISVKMQECHIRATLRGGKMESSHEFAPFSRTQTLLGSSA